MPQKTQNFDAPAGIWTFKFVVVTHEPERFPLVFAEMHRVSVWTRPRHDCSSSNGEGPVHFDGSRFPRRTPPRVPDYLG